MIIYRKCHHCGTEYKYENFANVITFCPNCHKYDQLECEYGYGPVVPCRIYLGEEVIGIVTYDDRAQTRYRFDAPKYNIHRLLEHTYMEALKEACVIAADSISVFLEPSQDVVVKKKGTAFKNDLKGFDDSKPVKSFKKENPFALCSLRICSYQRYSTTFRRHRSLGGFLRRHDVCCIVGISAYSVEKCNKTY